MVESQQLLKRMPNDFSSWYTIESTDFGLFSEKKDKINVMNLNQGSKPFFITIQFKDFVGLKSQINDCFQNTTAVIDLSKEENCCHRSKMNCKESDLHTRDLKLSLPSFCVLGNEITLKWSGRSKKDNANNLDTLLENIIMLKLEPKIRQTMSSFPKLTNRLKNARVRFSIEDTATIATKKKISSKVNKQKP
ncbi:hypothetical protein BY458DRAFT_543718 [Sporodiniella umbellata]|nr:hypothetical protein BY458DRAFT_543718 [Sporodiniella umbellata]